MNMYDLLDENYVIYTYHGAEGRFYLTLFCVNPKVNLQECLNKGRGTVFFSATLLPMGYYRSLFSTREDDYAICARSPFPRENLKLMIARDVSSKYTRRGQEEYGKPAQYILQTVTVKKGNYMVFFPSYKMLQDVYEIFEEKSSGMGMQSVLQSGNMTEGEKEEFLERFEGDQDGTLVDFCDGRHFFLRGSI